MKRSSVSFAIAFVALLGAGAAALHAQQLDGKPVAPDHWKALTGLAFNESYPSKEASERLYDELQFQRAVQVYLWALPAMNMVAMRDGQAATFGGGNNVLAVFKDRPNAKTISVRSPMSGWPGRTGARAASICCCPRATPVRRQVAIS